MIPLKKKDKVHSRQRYLAPSQKFLDWVNSLGIERSYFSRLTYFFDSNTHYRQALFLFFVSLVVSYFVFLDMDVPYNVRAGDVARTDIKSPISLQIQNQPTTEARRLEAERAIPPVYDFDPKAMSPVIDRVYLAFREMRSLSKKTAWPATISAQEEVVKDFFQYKDRFDEVLEVRTPNVVFQWLVEKRFGARIENILIEILGAWSKWKIVDGLPGGSLGDLNHLVAHEVGAGQVEFVVRASEIRDLRRRTSFPLPTLSQATNFERRELEHVTELARALVAPNLTLNRKETFERRKKARESVIPDQISIRKNQTIVNMGAQIQPHHVMILQEIGKIQADRRNGLTVFVTAILITALTLILFVFIKQRASIRLRVEAKDIVVMGLTSILTLLILKSSSLITDVSFLSIYGTEFQNSVFLYAAPVALGPMLIGLVLGSSEIVLLYTLIQSFILGLTVDFNLAFLLVSVATGLSAARWVQSCKKRNDIYWAGIKAGLVGALITFCVSILTRAGEQDLWPTLLWHVPASFVGGVLSAMVALTLVSLLESFFNYTTDVKLLELANLNHVLMQEMVVKAPGTYHHSLAVGSMVEAAANAIGANSLLAKVMAYYHDIGKMEHAQYFVENQRPGYNPHDHISPFMSKTILIAHVKDGAELGMEYKLGRPIIDGILQHHGTTLISYFYNKALEEHEEDMPSIDESEFRYPGPKPQFREAGLVMLADSIEAAARSIEEPTTARLQNLVKNIIQSKFIDGQLDECNLTLRELAVIEESFKRVLIGIYHHRIDYPHMRDGLLVPSTSKSKKPGLKKDTHTA